MRLLEKPREMQAWADHYRGEGKTIGFVPTMGYLHEGHMNLIKEARRTTDIVVVSIFVNPAQFGKGEDYKQYPRDLKGDRQKVERVGANILYVPSVADMYPKGYLTYVNVEEITRTMCGASRPGHFKGVATVVTKLFNTVKPHKAFFGQKDYQQSIVIKRIVRDLNMDVEIIVLPTMREPDDLAMSSRNSYLNKEERKAARILYRSLKKAEEMIKEGESSAKKIYDGMKRMIASEPLAKIEYITIADPETLKPLKEVREKTLIALAVWIGKTRLIDNIIVGNKVD